MITQTHKGGHIQGIAHDLQGNIYCSFTTELIKYAPDGALIGSVTGLTGHLGCLASGEDGRIWGSLEYKNDSIGQGIRSRVGGAFSGNGFYAVIFDGSKIDRMNMDAAADGVMTAVYLAEVVADYEYEAPLTGGGVLKHRFGCSGIDGMTFAPAPGDPEGKKLLCVAYGIYRDVNRADNDYQVILTYDVENWAEYARPLCETEMHTGGPAAPDGKYFIFTGNTTFGVQNLEYDTDHGRMVMAVYNGKKPLYPNHPMYIADWKAAPVHQRLRGFGDGTEGDVISLWRAGMYDEDSGIFGWEFPFGSTGMICLGGGQWLFSHPAKSEEGFSSEIVEHRWTGRTPEGFR